MTAIPTRDELVERARALVPALRERAARTEELRRLPEETLQDFVDAGFIRVAQPTRWGGMGHEPTVVVDICLEIARGCGSSGWLSSFYPLHQFMIGWFSEEAQQEYFGGHPDRLSATASAVTSLEREEVDGGIRLSAEWRFSSGVDYAEWIIPGTPNEFCLIPRSDFEVVDDWYVSGLCGTGSKSVRVEDVFVPEHRTVSHQSLLDGTAPSFQLNDSPWYQVHSPGAPILNHFILAPVIGMARGVLDLFDERARIRRDPQTFQPALERPGPQLRFAEASAELDAAEMFLRKNLADVREWGESGRQESVEERALIRRNIVYATRLATQAVNRLVDGMDSSALYDSSGLHRLARDFRAGCLQFVLHWEEAAIQWSRVHWGGEPHTVMI